MSKFNLIIEHSAEIDINQIADYIAEDNKKAALKTVKEIYKGFRLLCSHPNVGFEREEFTYRKVKFYIIKKHYLVVYTVIKNSIHILRVLTTYQDICTKL